jgi:hypothetical protein
VTIGPSLDDIFTEPTANPNTLANLGPLAPLAGVWAGRAGTDVHPKPDGPRIEAFTERFELQPIDPQTNGPQLLYGLRYHQHIVKPGEVETFHDQVGYLLWEPATNAVHMTLAIPRAQVALASGTAKPGDTKFTLRATAGDPHAGIVTSPFLDAAFHTPSWTITFRIGPGDTWSYEQTTVLDVHGMGPFDHDDSSTLTRLEPPTPNPLAAG